MVRHFITADYNHSIHVGIINGATMYTVLHDGSRSFEDGVDGNNATTPCSPARGRYQITICTDHTLKLSFTNISVLFNSGSRPIIYRMGDGPRFGSACSYANISLDHRVTSCMVRRLGSTGLPV